MNNFFAALIFTSLMLPHASCKKSTDFRIDPSQYTATDSACLFVGATDNSDWTYDYVWSAQESALMNFSFGLTYGDSIPGFVQISPPCPNPNQGRFVLGINTQKQCIMKMVCVNAEMEILFFETRESSGGPVLATYDLNAIGSFHKRESYRMYYACYTSRDSMYYKGHGDFRIE